MQNAVEPRDLRGSQAVGYTCHPSHQGRGGAHSRVTPDPHMQMHADMHLHTQTPKRLAFANMEALACADGVL